MVETSGGGAYREEMGHWKVRSSPEMGDCVGLRASLQPCWLRYLARERVRILSSCFMKLKNELHRQQEQVKIK
jgi:hypothetical protein